MSGKGDSRLFDRTGGLQFDYDTNKMRVTVDFMQEYRTDTTWYSGIPGEGGYYTQRRYTGDSLLKKKIQLNLP